MSDKLILGRVSFGPSRGGGMVVSGKPGYFGDPPGELEYALKGTTAENADLRELVREMGNMIAGYWGVIPDKKWQAVLARPEVKKIMEAQE